MSAEGKQLYPPKKLIPLNDLEKKWTREMVLENWDLFEKNRLSVEGMRILAVGLKKLHVYDEFDIVVAKIKWLKEHPKELKELQKVEEEWYKTKQLQDEIDEKEDVELQRELAEELEDDIEMDL